MRRELRNYRTALAMTKEALQQEHAKVDDERARLDCAMANTQGEPAAACRRRHHRHGDLPPPPAHFNPPQATLS
jgi:hypothetical protein